MPTNFVRFLENHKTVLSNNIRIHKAIDDNIFNDLPLFFAREFVESYNSATQIGARIEWWKVVLAKVRSDLLDETGELQEELKRFLRKIVGHEQKDAGTIKPLEEISNLKSILLDAYIDCVVNVFVSHYVREENFENVTVTSEKITVPDSIKKQLAEMQQEKIDPIIIQPEILEELPRKQMTPRKSSSNRSTPRKSTPRRKVERPLRENVLPQQAQLQAQLLAAQLQVVQSESETLQPQQTEQQQIEEQQLQQQKVSADQLCKDYQIHLLKEIQKTYPRSGSLMHYAVTPLEVNLPYKISFIDDLSKKIASPAINIAIEKYNVVAKMRAELHKEATSVVNQLSEFCKQLSDFKNIELLNKNRDSKLVQFLKLIHCVFSAITHRAYGGKAQFWKPHSQIFVEHLKQDVIPVPVFASSLA